MINFMYVGYYSSDIQEGEKQPATADATDRKAILLHHVEVIAIAEYFQVTDLASFAFSKLKQIFDQPTWPVASYPAALKMAYASTHTKELRQLLLLAAGRRIENLVGLKDFTFFEGLDEIQLDILERLIAEKKSLEALRKNVRAVHFLCFRCNHKYMIDNGVGDFFGTKATLTYCRKCEAQ